MAGLKVCGGGFRSPLRTTLPKKLSGMLFLWDSNEEHLVGLVSAELSAKLNLHMGQNLSWS